MSLKVCNVVGVSIVHTSMSLTSTWSCWDWDVMSTDVLGGIPASWNSVGILIPVQLKFVLIYWFLVSLLICYFPCLDWFLYLRVKHQLLPTMVPTDTGKSWNLRKEFSSTGKSWKMTMVMESHGKKLRIYWLSCAKLKLKSFPSHNGP